MCLPGSRVTVTVISQSVCLPLSISQPVSRLQCSAVTYYSYYDAAVEDTLSDADLAELAEMAEL